MEILYLLSEMSPYTTHTQIDIHTHIYVYSLSLTILIYLRTKSKVNSHLQIPAAPSATLWNKGRVIYAGGEIVYILCTVCSSYIKH